MTVEEMHQELRTAAGYKITPDGRYVALAEPITGPEKAAALQAERARLGDAFVALIAAAQRLGGI